MLVEVLMSAYEYNAGKPVRSKMRRSFRASGGLVPEWVWVVGAAGVVAVVMIVWAARSL